MILIKTIPKNYLFACSLIYFKYMSSPNGNSNESQEERLRLHALISNIYIGLYIYGNLVSSLCMTTVRRWTYTDDDGSEVEVIPAEIVSQIRSRSYPSSNSKSDQK